MSEQLTNAESNPSEASTRQAKSVFSLEYIPTSKAADFTVLTSGYFSISDTAVHDTNESNSDTFWEIIVTDLAEEHEEKFALHNTISDSIVIFSTGARPINVTIGGYVLLSHTDDHSYKLLNAYVEKFRARKLAAQNTHLTFVSQDTTFRLIIESMHLSRTVELESYLGVEISGLAYAYRQSGSSEAFSLGYYGEAAAGDSLTNAPEKPKAEQGEQLTNSSSAEARPFEQPGPFVGPPKPWTG